ncbi:a3452871-a4a7-40d3-acb3-b4986721c367 [Thermothielavioides terrestris]|uniref:A3452871-a4a7-40d3-acb3-b4986721c367 n=1 Tax=Thermothielavioides terrestris TaxID=2587410 RepID=A0A3S4ATG5_9PEZI|nr:a3452871-a4a7-40d3-acb3-b4986721c367 [Thermothielavioides terrestris]
MSTAQSGVQAPGVNAGGAFFKTGNAIIDRYYVELLHDQRTLAHVLHVIIVVVKEALARCRNLLRRGSLSSFP